MLKKTHIGLLVSTTALYSAVFLCAPIPAPASQASIVAPETGPHSLADFTTNYLDPALAAIASCFNGPSSPAVGPDGELIPYQCWIDTSTTPATYRINSGGNWSAIGTIGSGTDAWNPNLGSITPGILGYAGSGMGAVTSLTTLTPGLIYPNPTLTGDIVLQPTFTSANAGNAGVYSVMANPANGYSTVYNELQVSLGAPITAAGQAGRNIIGLQQTIVGTLNIQAGDDATAAGFGVAGYASSESTVTGAVGIGGFGFCSATNTNGCWGANLNVSNVTPYVAGATQGFATPFIAGNELDLSLDTLSDGSNPSPAVYGEYLTGGGSATNNIGTGFAVDVLSQVTLTKWTNGFATLPGGAVNAFTAGPAARGNNTGSSNLIFQSTDSSGATRIASEFTDSSGNLFLTPHVGNAIILQDGSGNTLMSMSSTQGGVSLGGISTPGVITNDSSGLLASAATTGTGNVVLGNSPGITNLYLTGGIIANGTGGVTCGGLPTSTFATSGGVVTHC